MPSSCIKVFSCWWWMIHLGGRTPKRHIAYSNSPFVRNLWCGKLTGWKHNPMGRSNTTRAYVDASGKHRYTGTKFLKRTQILGANPYIPPPSLIDILSLLPFTVGGGWVCGRGVGNYMDMGGCIVGMMVVANPRSYPKKFGVFLQHLLPGFLSENPSRPVLTASTSAPCAKTLFYDMPMGDTWPESGIVDLIIYLRGNRHLCIPPDWRGYIPTSI